MPEPQEGRKLVAQVEKYSKDKSSRPWIPEGVRAECRTSYKVQRQFEVLDEKDFRRVMGRDPKSKDPKLQCVTLEKNGEKVKYYVFKGANPIQNLIVTEEFGEYKEEVLLDPMNNVREQQGHELHQKCKLRRLAEAGELNLQLLPTIDEHKSKIREKDGVAERGAVSQVCALASTGARPNRDPRWHAWVQSCEGR